MTIDAKVTPQSKLRKIEGHTVHARVPSVSTTWAARLLEMLDEERTDMESTLIDVCLEDDAEIPKQNLVVSNPIYIIPTCQHKFGGGNFGPRSV